MGYWNQKENELDSNTLRRGSWHRQGKPQASATQNSLASYKGMKIDALLIYERLSSGLKLKKDEQVQTI